MKPGDKFKVREGAPYMYTTNAGGLGVVLNGGSSREVVCVSTYNNDGELLVVGRCCDKKEFHFFAKDCTVIPTKSKVDIIIEYMERKAEIIAVLTDGKVRDFFTKEDADEIKGWGDAEAKYILGKLVPCLGNRGCPFCIIYCLDHTRAKCHFCSYGARHGCCDPTKPDNTYGMVIRYISVIPDSYVQELKGILEQ